MRRRIYENVVKALQYSDNAVLLDLLFLAGLLWLAHFFHFQALGLYADDYTHTSPALGWQLRDAVSWALDAFRWWDLGRPLGYALGGFLSFLGAQLGGLGAMYIIAYLVHLANTILVYFLFKRLGHRGFALIGGLIFGLFPADTTHIFLMHSFGLHTSLTFLLLASHTYLSGNKTLAHVLSLACLLIYESPYVVFLAIPLLCRPWDQKLPREMLRHFATWLGILLAVVAIRVTLGEGRIETLGSSSASTIVVFQHILAALAIGPAVSLRTFWEAPRWTLSHWNRELSFVFLGTLPVFIWMLYRLRTAFRQPESSVLFVVPIKLFRRERTLRLTVAYPKTVKLLMTALLMLSLAYGLSFTHFPPTVTYGRLTSVHLAAAFGGAMLFACLASIFLDLAQWRHVGMLGIAVVALYLSLLVSYCFSIQQDFMKAWRNEKRFWTSAVAQVPDMTDGTVILVLERGLPQSRFITTNSWSDPLILTQLYAFPPAWTTPPRLFVMPSNWSSKVALRDGQLQWIVPAATWDAHSEVLPDSNVIVLRWQNGRLVRQFRSIMIQGQELHLKPMPPNASQAWPKGTLYPLLIAGTK